MTWCDVQASGAIELYFYDELKPVERASVEHHVRACRECAHALEELRVIRDALATRPDVAAPASGDWSGFMARLDAAIAREPIARPRDPRRADTGGGRGRRSAERVGGTRAGGYFAMAALLALVTASVTTAWRVRHEQPARTAGAVATATPSATTQTPVADGSTGGDMTVADFETLSDEHFERSKLVVLGLATKDPADRRASDWAYERALASSLLNDTRMYRMAAEDRGLSEIAGVMRDLEIVLLQTSMTDEKDPSALPQIQRLIQKRDLLDKMDAVAAPQGRTAGTKGI
jgi:DNA-binding transcriptional regulator YdaS (Cro superfamily)